MAAANVAASAWISCNCPFAGHGNPSPEGAGETKRGLEDWLRIMGEHISNHFYVPIMFHLRDASLQGFHADKTNKKSPLPFRG
jgi:hypothetical protein